MFPSDETNVIIKERNDRKSIRKQKRAHHRLFRDMNIKCTEQPTQVNAKMQSFVFMIVKLNILCST